LGWLVVGREPDLGRSNDPLALNLLLETDAELAVGELSRLTLGIALGDDPAVGAVEGSVYSVTAVVGEGRDPARGFR
jgi:hypothetical protein